jgi:oligopeptide transport system permease protein
VVVGLLFFTLAGPVIWTVDPSAQDLDQVSQPPSAAQSARVVAEIEPWFGESGMTIEGVAVVGSATTQAVKLQWSPLAGANGYRLYRNLYSIGPERAFGIPIAEYFDNATLYFEDRFDLEPRSYFYSVVPLGPQGQLLDTFEVIEVNVERVITPLEAVEKGLVSDISAVTMDEILTLDWHPLGTDYLGRDMLARLMAGARVSLFIGIGAPFLFVLFGVFYGSLSGFIGGKTDQFMMRFADFVVALPFLLFMILFKIAFGVGPGESGVFPLLVALVVLMWPSTARLVRGQILQIREQAYISASQLLGAKTNYLILRHMIPNTLGVVLVTLTFAIPSAIFTEAFLSFIGMGVAPPTPSWGSMSNEGIKTMLTTPHELILPALLISITVLAFNLLGDGLRDSLDARMRNQE